MESTLELCLFFTQLRQRDSRATPVSESAGISATKHSLVSRNCSMPLLLVLPDYGSDCLPVLVRVQYSRLSVCMGIGSIRALILVR